MGRRLIALAAVAAALATGGCDAGPGRVPLAVPHGYQSRLEFVHDGVLYGFGPFVGYYFRPDDPRDPVRVDLVCFNEQGFYASDAPVNALLYEGTAVRTRLPGAGRIPPGPDRIRPVFFPRAPAAWLAARPDPQDAFVHFHSCYTRAGPVRLGFWIRHRAVRGFTYDMGGRVGPGSPLYHRVRPGVDLAFARIVEFDAGPGRPGDRPPGT